MRLLLDTHTLIWALGRDLKLSPVVSSLLSARSHSLLVSSASLWEISIKRSTRKIDLAPTFDASIDEYFAVGFFTWLPIELRHIRRVATLPFHHRDPFDRMLVAQALEDGLTLLSADAALDPYSASRIW